MGFYKVKSDPDSESEMKRERREEWVLKPTQLPSLLGSSVWYLRRDMKMKSYDGMWGRTIRLV